MKRSSLVVVVAIALVSTVVVSPTLVEGHRPDGPDHHEPCSSDPVGGGHGDDPDPDRDWLNDAEESAHGTDPCHPDSDGDGLPDGWEVHYGLDPSRSNSDATGPDDWDDDRDGDGLANWEDYCYDLDGTDRPDPWDCRERTLTTWNHRDTDGHPCPDDPSTTCRDGVYWGGLDPSDPDTDNDALCDGGGTNTCREIHLSGRAAGEVVHTGTNATDPDTDDDGMPDGWEHAYGLDPGSDGDRTADPDRDTYVDFDDGEVDQPWTNIQEYCYGSGGFDAGDDPQDATCVATREAHVRENGVYLGGTDPSDAYTDDDCGADGWEVDQGYDPTDGSDVCPATEAGDQIDEDKCRSAENQRDSDGDGLSNGFEDRWTSDRCDPDTDDDGLWDDQEWEYGSDPDDPDGDSDEDGLSDRDEVMVHGCDPANEDADSDSLLDPDEIANGTNCSRMDSDGDGVPDGTEVHGWTTPEPNDPDDTVLVTSDPLAVNSDPDTLDDEAEYFLQTDPRSADTDGDGLGDGEEAELDTNPLTRDTDGDGTRDGLDQDADSGASTSGASSTQSAGLDPDALLTRPSSASTQSHTGSDSEQDSDGDGLSDHEEKEWTFTDPYDADSDGDQLSDYEEVRVWDTQPWKPDTDADGIPDMADPVPRGDNTPPAIKTVRARSVCGSDQPGDGDHPEDAYYHWWTKYSNEMRHTCKAPKERVVVRAVDRTGVGIDEELGVQVIDHGDRSRSCHLDSEDAVVQRRDRDHGVVEMRIVLSGGRSLDGECGLRFKVRDHVDYEDPERVNKVEVIVSHLDGWDDEGLLKPNCVSKMAFAAEYVGASALQRWATGAWVVVRADDYASVGGLAELAGNLAMDTVWVLGELGEKWVKRTGLALAVNAGVTLMDANARLCDLQDDSVTSSGDVHVNPQGGSNTDRIQANSPDGGTKDVYLVYPGFHEVRTRPDNGVTAHRGAGWERVHDGAPEITPDDVETILTSDDPVVAGDGDIWVYSGCSDGERYEVWVAGRFVYRANGPWDC